MLCLFLVKLNIVPNFPCLIQKHELNVGGLQLVIEAVAFTEGIL